MKITVYMGMFASWEINPALFEQLWHLVPEARSGPTKDGKRALNIGLPLEDSRVEKARNILTSHGMKPWDTFHEKQVDEFRIQLRRNYEPLDLEAAELLEPRVDVFLPDRGKDESGRVLLEAHSIRHQLEIGLAAARYFLVSDRVKMEMEAAFPLGEIAFREVVPVSGGKKCIPKTWNQVGKPWWELSSDILMPKTDWSRLRHEDGEQFTGDYSKGCYPVDGLYKPAELHYQRGAIRNMPSFAIGMTYESFGNGRVFARSPIASKKFYELCRTLKLKKMTWIPVRIDD